MQDHYYPQSAASPPHDDFLDDLARQDTPTLLIKGRCDYLSWSSALDYLKELPDAPLVYLGGGHNAYQDDAPDAH